MYQKQIALIITLKLFLKKFKNVKKDLKIALKLQMPSFLFLFETCRFK